MAFHVIHRGNNRGACFVDAADREFYLGLLGEISRLEDCAIHAYVLMTNHIHLLATPARADGLSRFMKRVAQRYTARFNRLWSRTGTLWDGRFRSSLVDTANYLMTCHRYIEQNPVRAGMVARPGDYPWSSHATNAQGKPSLFLQPHSLYLELAADPGDRCERYGALFDSPVAGKDLSRIRDAINGGLPLGSDTFLARLAADLKCRVARGRCGPRVNPR